jgi:hypothetical protein
MRTRPASLGLAAVLLLAGCGQAAAPASGGPADDNPASPAATPAASPPSSLPSEAIQHPTGAGDVILRVSQVGGFVRMESLLGRIPVFTLYGDGRVLLSADDSTGGAAGGGGLNPGANPGGPIPGTPLAEARLDENAVQQILGYAITQGGLGTAKATYRGTIPDLPTTVFEIHTADVDRTVSVRALTADPAPGPDAAAYRALASLLAKLGTIGTVGEFTPAAWIAVLGETGADPAAPAAAWPWPDLAPSAFAQPAGTDPVPFPKHILTQAQVDAVGAAIGPGGASGFRFAGPDGKTYVVAIRPALPEEAAAS